MSSARRWVIQLYEVQHIIVRTASNRKCFGGLYSDDDDEVLMLRFDAGTSPRSNTVDVVVQINNDDSATCIPYVLLVSPSTITCSILDIRRPDRVWV